PRAAAGAAAGLRAMIVTAPAQAISSPAVSARRVARRGATARPKLNAAAHDAITSSLWRENAQSAKRSSGGSANTHAKMTAIETTRLNGNPNAIHHITNPAASAIDTAITRHASSVSVD